MTPGPSKLRVLVVDDEPMIAETLGIILQKAGFEASICYDGCAAIDAARDFGPDIVLADYEMPKMNGIDACVEIRAMLPSCRIVVLSGYSLIPQEPSRLDFLLLTKPLPPNELLEVLGSLC